MHQVVQLANGQWSLRSLDVAETYHPVIGPESEAETLYANQIHMERMEETTNATPFVVWDVGLGGAANALAIIKHAADFHGKLHLISFDHSLEPLRVALSNADKLPYLQPYAKLVQQVLNEQTGTDVHPNKFQHGKATVEWQFVLGDFPTWLKEEKNDFAVPHGILYDAFSPKKNADMYTLEVFKNLVKHLNNQTPCILASYSRSTLLRTTLLLAGLYVGRGAATGEKEETTIASNRYELISNPLPKEWLERAQRSTSAEPLHTSTYIQSPLTPDTLHILLSHPQWRKSQEK